MKTLFETEQELRAVYLTHENIAKYAYEMWERDGRPDSNAGTQCRPESYWFKAEFILRMLAEDDASTLFWLRVIGED